MATNFSKHNFIKSFVDLLQKITVNFSMSYWSK